MAERPMHISLVPMLKDNYAYLLHCYDTGATGIVDPSEAEPALQAARRQDWRITHVLDTHHHNDHCGGNLGIKEQTGAKVVGPAYDKDRIPGIDIPVDEESGFTFGAHPAQVLFIPGHTKGHIAFYFPESKALFCGDTLFSYGCGRMFEGTSDMMWKSLMKLRALPDDTQVYCGHEYTEANLRFAVDADPGNDGLWRRQAEVQRIRAEGKPTIPANLGEEKKLNPFLRADEPDMRKRFGGENKLPHDVFGAMRAAKDKF